MYMTNGFDLPRIFSTVCLGAQAALKEILLFRLWTLLGQRSLPVD